MSLEIAILDPPVCEQQAEILLQPQALSLLGQVYGEDAQLSGLSQEHAELLLRPLLHEYIETYATEETSDGYCSSIINQAKVVWGFAQGRSLEQLQDLGYKNAGTKIEGFTAKIRNLVVARCEREGVDIGTMLSDQLDAAIIMQDKLNYSSASSDSETVNEPPPPITANAAQLSLMILTAARYPARVGGRVDGGNCYDSPDTMNVAQDDPKINEIVKRCVGCRLLDLCQAHGVIQIESTGVYGGLLPGQLDSLREQISIRGEGDVLAGAGQILSEFRRQQAKGQQAKDSV